MTFLNPFVLFGLAAAAIPLLLHLLNIRKLRTIDFSTVAFLKELQKSRMRKVRIRQWLLLIVRTLIILFLVFAFSRPALKGTLAGLGTHAKTTIVIILDDTYSMSLRGDRGVYLKQAQTCALGLIDLLSEGDDALLIRLSDLPAATIGEPTHDVQMLREAISQTTVKYKRRTVEEALAVAGRLLQRSKNFNKEIYILTDDQKTSIESGLREENTLQAGKLFDPNVRMFFVPFSDQSFENVGIAAVDVAPTLFQRGKPFALQATIRNYGSAQVQNHLVNLFLNGVRVMQKSVTLEGHTQKTLDFTATPQQAGILRGRVELEDDDFAEDNSRFFSVTVPDKVNVLLSSSDPRSLSYIRLALSVHNQDDATTLVRFTELLPQQLTYSAMVQADVVLLSNVASLSSAQAEQLAQFSSQGGGIVIFPGDAMQVAAYNASLLPALQLPPLRPLEKQTGTISFVSFEKVDYDHPIFHGMFESGSGPKMEKKEIESPRVSIAMRFASEKDVRSIISLSDGTPFLWERIPGKLQNKTNAHGVLGFAVAANTSWSDFPLKGIFIPLLYQTILYAASGGSTLLAAPSSLVGDRVDIALSRAAKLANSSLGTPTLLRVLDPAGKETLVQPNLPHVGGSSIYPAVSLDNTSQPGIYTVVRSRDTVAAVPVNVDPAESIAERCTPAEFVKIAGRHGIEKSQIVFVKSSESISTVVLQSRFGVELWKYFLLAALILALLEMALGRESKQEGV